MDYYTENFKENISVEILMFSLHNLQEN